MVSGEYIVDAFFLNDCNGAVQRPKTKSPGTYRAMFHYILDIRYGTVLWADNVVILGH